jgi:hypothetical protein
LVASTVLNAEAAVASSTAPWTTVSAASAMLYASSAAFWYAVTAASSAAFETSNPSNDAPLMASFAFSAASVADVLFV